MRRNPEVVTKRGVKFAINRCDWCNLENFELMYQLIYNEFVDAGVAKRLEGDGKWLDINGNEVEEQEAFGRKCTHLLTHPEYVLFVDEVGSNTNMTKDGNKGGEKLACERGSQPRQQASSNDIHFTTLGFTNALGQPILCGIIITGHQLSANDILGIDVMKGQLNNNEMTIENIATSEMFPGGPTCEVMGGKSPLCDMYSSWRNHVGDPERHVAMD